MYERLSIFATVNDDVSLFEVLKKVQSQSAKKKRENAARLDIEDAAHLDIAHRWSKSMRLHQNRNCNCIDQNL